MKKKKMAVIFILIILIASILYLIFVPKKDRNELTLYGNVEIRQVDLGFRIQGRLIKLFNEEGDYVKKGQLMALMDDIPFKAAYEKSVAQVALDKSASINSKTEYERNVPLCRENTTSQVECDNLYTRMNEAQAQLESSIQQSVSAKDDYDNTKIYAPNDGVVTTRVQEEGAVVTPGGAVYTITLTQPIWVRTYIPETALGNIKYGMKAKVLTDSIDPETGKHREYEGWIGYISPVAEFTPKTVQTTDLRTDLVYRIRVYVYEVDRYLRQGMPTTVKINLKETEVDETLKEKYNE